MEMARRTATTEVQHEATAKVELARNRSLGTRNWTSVTLPRELGHPGRETVRAQLSGFVGYSLRRFGP